MVQTGWWCWVRRMNGLPTHLELLRILVFQSEQSPAPPPGPGQLLRHFVVPQGQCLRNREGPQSLPNSLCKHSSCHQMHLCLVHSEANNPKRQSLEPRKVYCSAKPGGRVAHTSETPELP